MPANQTSLDAFDSGDTDTDESTSRTTTASASTSREFTSPLDDTYERIVEQFNARFHPSYEDLTYVTPLSSRASTGQSFHALPEGHLLPSTIGGWTLDFHEDREVTYRTDSQGRKREHGETGVVHRYVARGDSKPTTEAKAMLKMEYTVACENPSMVRNADTSEDSHLHPRGFSPKDYSGDHGVYSGILVEFDSYTEAIYGLLAHLHATPAGAPSTARRFDTHDLWTLTQAHNSIMRWTAPAPTEVPAETVQLFLKRDEIAFRYDSPNGAPVRTENHPVPVPTSVQDFTSADSDSVSAPSLAPLLTVAEHALTFSPSEILEASPAPLTTDPS
jgi:hypothetical protein